MDNNVRLQNLREMTVQIRRVDDDAIVGTGIAVSTDGRIVTCAHVVETAIGAHPRNANGAEISVYFPQARGGETKARRATVAACFPQHDDDVVLLQLTSGASPLAPEQIAVLGQAEESDTHDFQSFGYRALANYQGLPAFGKIVGLADKPAERVLLGDPVILSSQQIDRGMSGAGVLDVEKNLVVGIIAETWDSGGRFADRDTNFAVNARVLSLAPLGLSLRDEPYPMRAAPQPKTDTAEARAAVAPTDRFVWNSAPSVLNEWTGRDDLLAQITQDWLNPQKHVTGLIGFGGEGKSSLARKWVDLVIARSEATKQSPNRELGIASQKPLAMTEKTDGVFWWGSYENRSVDEFLEAALKWMSGGRIDPRAVPSSSLRAQIIGAMLGAGRYLLVLDGLEVMQHQEGDRFGLLQSNDLRDLLTYFARPDNASFCLVTSRAPLLDLMEYTTYTHRDVDRLSAADGRALLRKLGLQGKDDALEKLVADWDGHALTLSLLAAILTERYGGDVAHVADLPAPTMNEEPVLSGVEGRYERVHRVLRRYDEHLTDAEREFLKLFSAFRTPVKEDAFDRVFRPLLGLTAEAQRSQSFSKKILGALRVSAVKKEDELISLVNRLVTYRILRFDAHDRTYTTHPLIRNHYLALLTKGDPAQEKAVHEQIKDYYLSIAGDTPQYPTLDNLKPLIEAVHHACQAGAYDEAGLVFYERIDQRRAVIVHQLGAYETAIALFFEFFPNGDASREPQVSDPRGKCWILNNIGLCLMSLGRLGEAVPFFNRANVMQLAQRDWNNTSVTYRNLAELHAHLGVLKASADVAKQELDLARRAESKVEECYAIVKQGWVVHLQGDLQKTSSAFTQAEKLEQVIDPTIRYLYGMRGIQHANHLRRASNLDYACRVTEANLKICEQYHWSDEVGMSHRVLGDLDADASQHTSARVHYDTALKIARSISHRPSLIEALLARGRWAAKFMKDAPSAFNDLNEALGYAVEGGYRIYETDIRVALAWEGIASSKQSAEGIRQTAKTEAERALRMSEEMGYYWGKVDAEEVLQRIGSG